MTDICFYFQVHQPNRLRRYSVFEIGRKSDYFDDNKNEEIMRKVSRKCYLPANSLILDLIRSTGGKFRVSYSITGTALEQFQKYCPSVIESFRRLAETGAVEFLSETYYHSLSFLYSKEDFNEQVKMHSDKIFDLFGIRPKVFRNTELIYNNELANHLEGMGYGGVLAEGADHVLGWRSPNFIYRPRGAKKIKLLLKNYRLSDDIAFRFSNTSWAEYPLTASKFAQWVNILSGPVLNLFMDYETFGEHQWSTTGIFNFLRSLPGEILKNPYHRFMTPSEICAAHEPVSELDIHHPISWADMERDLSAWLGNKMQNEAIHHLFRLEKAVKNAGDKQLLDDWRYLQTSDHYYYMCTKWFNDGDVHKYFNPYDSPYEGFITFMNILNDFASRLKSREAKREGLRIEASCDGDGSHAGGASNDPSGGLVAAPVNPLSILHTFR